MTYKALMLDIDGTITPYDYSAFPSEKVCEAILKASQKLSVSLVTGRGFASVKKILAHIGLKSGYGAINNGSYVFDIRSGDVIYDQPINDNSTEKIVEILMRQNIPFFLKQFQGDEYTIHAPYKKGDPLEKAYMMYSEELFNHEKLTRLFNEFSSINDITLHKTRHKDPNMYGFNITHAMATKAHAIEVILEQIHVKRDEVIGVGDSYNDFPLLMASGLKVAMGNALQDLKDIADFVAPSVHEDGVVHIIEKYILSNE